MRYGVAGLVLGLAALAGCESASMVKLYGVRYHDVLETVKARYPEGGEKEPGVWVARLRSDERLENHKVKVTQVAEDTVLITVRYKGGPIRGGHEKLAEIEVLQPILNDVRDKVRPVRVLKKSKGVD